VFRSANQRLGRLARNSGRRSVEYAVRRDARRARAAIAAHPGFPSGRTSWPRRVVGKEPMAFQFDEGSWHRRAGPWRNPLPPTSVIPGIWLSETRDRWT